MTIITYVMRLGGLQKGLTRMSLHSAAIKSKVLLIARRSAMIIDKFNVVALYHIWASATILEAVTSKSVAVDQLFCFKINIRLYFV